VGLPVYNAAAFLKTAIESHLSQTYGGFELVISDNCSSDDTQGICELYARLDRRIRYYRESENRGVNWNHWRVFSLAQSEYFRWAGADDIPAPELIGDAVATLDARPDAVAYAPDTVNIDQNGDIIRHLDRNLDIQFDDVIARTRAVLTRGYQMIYDQGLIRRDALTKTSMRWNYFGYDYILLLELAILGKIIQPPGPLLYRRLHGGSTALNTRKASEVRKWVDPTVRARFLLPHWKWSIERVLACMCIDARLSLMERARVLALVLRHTWWTRDALGKDIRMAVQMGLGKTDEYPF
jgi:glycosyltransferase involved in cell wall biosynthesis